MLEVKRKPGDSHSDSGGTGTAARRTYEREPSHAENQDVLENLNSGATKRPKRIPVLVSVPSESRSYQTRTPVITGEAHYRGTLPVDGMLSGKLDNGGSLAIRQRSGYPRPSHPELAGDISFREMLRVNGHIAGTVYSKTGTLIVDDSAIVDANVEVGTAIISGTINGDIVARVKVEIGPTGKIHGNIWTRSIALKDGGFFDGVCTMIEEY